MKLDQEEALRMILEGMSYKEVADLFSCSRTLLAHYFGPEHGSNKKSKMKSVVEDNILVRFRRRIKDALAEATTKEDFSKRIREILSSLEAVLFALFEPSEAQEQAA